MMPVRPAPSSRSVSSCWRKLQQAKPVDLHQVAARSRSTPSISDSPSRTNASRSSSAGRGRCSRNVRTSSGRVCRRPGEPIPTARWTSGRRRSRWKCRAADLSARMAVMVELARHVPGDVLHAKANDLVCHPARHHGDALSDQGIHRRGRQAVGLERLEVEDPARERHRPAFRRAAVEIGEQPALAARAVIGLVHQLTPQIGAHVLERTGIPHPRRHPVLHVVVAERHVAPVGRGHLPHPEQGATVLERRSGRTGRRLRPRRARASPGTAPPLRGAAPAASRPPAPGGARREPRDRAPDTRSRRGSSAATSTPTSSNSRRIVPVSVERGVS